MPASATNGRVKGEKERLNDLSAKEWLKHSKSVILDVVDRSPLSRISCALGSGSLISLAPRRDAIKKDHPATFSEKDVARLVRFFSKSGDTVLDPFMGSGSTALACMEEGRHCIGFELYQKWYELARQRVDDALLNCPVSRLPQLGSPDLRLCDAWQGLVSLESESIDFLVTSPPYWGILEKKDHKAKKERVENGLSTDYGDDPLDLANIQEYHEFLNVLGAHFKEYHRILKAKSYAAVIVSDFRHGDRYCLFHADVAARMEEAGFTIQGLMVLIQDNKRLYPYGYPTTFVPNISNQYIVVGRRL